MNNSNLSNEQISILLDKSDNESSVESDNEQWDDSDKDETYQPNTNNSSSDDNDTESVGDLVEEVDPQLMNSNVDSIVVEDVDESDWVDTENDIADFPFEQVSGINIPLARDVKPFDVFNLFFADNILDHVVEKTNIYAHKLIDKP